MGGWFSSMINTVTGDVEIIIGLLTAMLGVPLALSWGPLFAIPMWIIDFFLIMDGLERSEVYMWQEELGITWGNIFWNYGLGGVEAIAGAFAAYKSLEALWSGIEQFTYKGITIAIGLAGLGVAGGLLYDSYRRIFQFEHTYGRGPNYTWGTPSTTTRVNQYSPEKSWDEVGFTWSYKDDPNEVMQASIEMARKKCKENSNDYVWDEETSKCITKSTYDNYKAAMLATENEKKVAQIVANRIDIVTNEDGTVQIPSISQNPSFWNKKVGEFTCQDWLLYNNPSYWDSDNRDNSDWTGLGDIRRLQLNLLDSSAPSECLDAVRKAGSIDFVPTHDNTMNYINDYFSTVDEDATLPDLLGWSSLNPFAPAQEPPTAESDTTPQLRTTRDVNFASNVKDKGNKMSYRNAMNRYANQGKRRVTGGKKFTV
jgi:hypothetical protein